MTPREISEIVDELGYQDRLAHYSQAAMIADWMQIYHVKDAELPEPPRRDFEPEGPPIVTEETLSALDGL